MTKIYRQVSVNDTETEKGRLPIDGIKYYITDVGQNVAFIPLTKLWFDGRNTRNVEWWLEEIELPDKEDLIKEFPIDSKYWWKYANSINEARRYGAKWVIDFILNKQHGY